MSLRTLLIAAAVCAMLLLTGQGTAEAGFLPASPTMGLGMDDMGGYSPLNEGAGEAPADSGQKVDPDFVVAALSAVFAGSAGAVPSGGMSSSTPDVSGPNNPIFAATAAMAKGHEPMVAWLGAEGRAALPPPVGTGILRPPRAS